MLDDSVVVLVIDDDQAVVDMIRMGLQADGMRVLSAGDGAEGIEVLGRERVDVIVLDIMMPRVDGWMALMDIRSHPLTADTPVIMAVGTRANPLLKDAAPDLELSRRGYIVTNDDGGTSIPGVFAGGDIVTGAATVILAMGAGKKAAQAMDRWLRH